MITKKIKIKICGITDEQSLDVAFKLKVDYVGFVFYPSSPRNISLDKVNELIKLKNHDTKIVALTVNAKDCFLEKIINKINPDYIQFHGSEGPNKCAEIRSKYNVKIIRALEVQNIVSLNREISKYRSFVDEFILDAPKSFLPGGNGEKFDWEILNNNKIEVDWLIAGGLNISNIKNALLTTKAMGVDVSSGVEISRGKKSPKLIEDFVLKCKNIEKVFLND